MDASVKKAMLAALRQYAAISKKDSGEFYDSLVKVFDDSDDYLKKVAAMDSKFDDNPEFESLRELFFDLLLINFFNEDVRKLEEDYLDSPEWEAIEEKTLDRGTELLNLMLYLKECEDEDIEPELEDFLKEFLLVDEDEFQDEHRIYEDIIANQILIDSDLKEVARVANTLPEDSELRELFYPMMGFFRDQHPDNEDFDEFVKYSKNAEFDSAVYALLISYNQR
ncbi:hypothetical protein [Daejeonella lutea]|uniref:Uncharacterized protein n=1 Tax=Daejeonella lutea TaxID=572036 RepID=A0A1T5EXD6_9SPHI|nr:hypothetical protein [Daejeonella lutea]SKB88561.1 hypothetical protein SAMN05661099_3256 [Daejeonella lutea]